MYHNKHIENISCTQANWFLFSKNLVIEIESRNIKPIRLQSPAFHFLKSMNRYYLCTIELQRITKMAWLALALAWYFYSYSTAMFQNFKRSAFFTVCFYLIIKWALLFWKCFFFKWNSYTCVCCCLCICYTD